MHLKRTKTQYPALSQRHRSSGLSLNSMLKRGAPTPSYRNTYESLDRVLRIAAGYWQQNSTRLAPSLTDYLVLDSVTALSFKIFPVPISVCSVRKEKGGSWPRQMVPSLSLGSLAISAGISKEYETSRMVWIYTPSVQVSLAALDKTLRHTLLSPFMVVDPVQQLSAAITRSFEAVTKALRTGSRAGLMRSYHEAFSPQSTDSGIISLAPVWNPMDMSPTLPTSATNQSKGSPQQKLYL